MVGFVLLLHLDRISLLHVVCSAGKAGTLPTVYSLINPFDLANISECLQELIHLWTE